MVAAASVEEAFTVAASVGAVFEEEAFTAVLPVEAFEVGFFAVVLTLLAFAAAFVVMAFAEVAFVAAAFMMVAFAAVGSTIAASTMGSPSLVILVTRSFTTPVHTTGTIPIAIILAITLMVTDTVALPAAAFVAVAFVAVASVAVAFMAVADPYNQSVYQGSAGYSDQLVGQIKLRVPRGTLLLWLDRWRERRRHAESDPASSESKSFGDS
jgi:signal transduction histidine kinase